MANYVLGTDTTNKSFTFVLGDLKYDFRYPTMKEMRELQALNLELREMAENKASKEEIVEQGKRSEEKMNTLITPVDHDNAIADVLEEQPVNVVREFRAMMAKEISLE